MRIGALPTALNLTVTFDFANAPALCSADVASLGNCVRTTEAVIVIGRSASGSVKSGIAGLSGAVGDVEDIRSGREKGRWDGEDMFVVVNDGYKENVSGCNRSWEKLKMHKW